MLRQSIQRIKAMLLYIEYGILFVNTVNTKIKVCNALNAMFVEGFGGLTVHQSVQGGSFVNFLRFVKLQG